jgi:hypothetical protein
MSETFTHDNLLAGDQRQLVNLPATVDLGQVLSRGALLGRILRAIGAAAADPGNTGEGTISNEALTADAEVGTYQIVCVAAGPPAVFAVYTPDGTRIEDATAEVSYSCRINFLIEAYGTAFAAGDTFTVEVEEGSLEVTQASRVALDGSAEPYAVLAEDVDATLAPVLTSVYVEGEFSEDNVGYAAGDDADDWREPCRLIGIYLRPTVAV